MGFGGLIALSKRRGLNRISVKVMSLHWQLVMQGSSDGLEVSAQNSVRTFVFLIQCMVNILNEMS